MANALISGSGVFLAMSQFQFCFTKLLNKYFSCAKIFFLQHCQHTQQEIKENVGISLFDFVIEFLQCIVLCPSSENRHEIDLGTGRPK